MRDCLKWLLANTLQLTGNQTAAGVETFSDRSVHAGAYTPNLTPAHSATPTFDCSLGSVFEPGKTVTSNITSITMGNPVAGQTVNIIFKEDATGGRTIAVPQRGEDRRQPIDGANRISVLVMHVLRGRVDLDRQLAAGTGRASLCQTHWALQGHALGVRRRGRAGVWHGTVTVNFPTTAQAGDLAVFAALSSTLDRRHRAGR